MHWYEVVKLIHYLALIALFGAFVIYPRAGARLRASTTEAEARAWLGMLELTRGMVNGGAPMMVVSGGLMAWLRWRALYPFTAIGALTLTLAWILFVASPSRHLRLVRAALAQGEGEVPPNTARMISKPGPWTAMMSINLAVLGVLAEMTLKLGWTAGVALVAGAAVLGAVIARTILRREQRGV